MKKIYIIIITGLLILTSFSITSTAEEKKEIENINLDLVFYKPTISINAEKTDIEIAQANAYTMEPGKPMLPVYKKTYDFPVDAKILDVEIKLGNKKTMKIDEEIPVAPTPVQIKTLEKKSCDKKNIKNLNSPYPEKDFEYSIGRGLVEEKPTLFLKIQINPLSYDPIEKTLTYIDSAEIDIKYKKQDIQITNTEDANLLILSPKNFTEELQPLVTHKENKSINISTKHVNIKEILNGTYFSVQGRDDIEKIKYFIKNAYDKWGTRNVLIVGGEDKFPARKTHIRIYSEEDGTEDKEIFLSDLYYADLYNGSNNFSSWDTNNNDIFAEINWNGNFDELDCYPDVKIGRLTCTDETQVQTVVNKIITYETGKAWSKNWFNEIVVIGGDSIPRSYGDDSGIDEGEYLNQAIIDSLDGFIPNKIWDSNKKLSGRFPRPNGVRNIDNAIKSGCGFVDFSGHGAPWIWTTFPHNGIRQSLPTPLGMYTNYDIKDLTNGEKLPIVMCGGCSLGKYSDDPDCFAWSFLSNPNGGGIASFGATALGYVYLSEWVTYGLVEGLALKIFEAYQNGSSTFGEMWTDAYNNYINNIELNDVDYKTLAEWQPFGDPTLKIRSKSKPPEKPDKPKGSESGRIIKKYTYTASTTEPDKEEMYYLFDWDDGTYSGWLGPYDSSEEVTASHRWFRRGDYKVKVKAKDENGVQGNWSEEANVKVRISTSKAVSSLYLKLIDAHPKLFQFMERILNQINI